MLMLFAGLIANHALKSPSLSFELVWGAPVVLFSILTAFQIGALAGLDGFRRSARLLLLLMCVQVPGVALLAWQFGLSGAVIGMTVSFGIRAWVCHWLLHREAVQHSIRPMAVDPAFAREMLFGFMLPGALTGLTAMPALWFVTTALSRTADGFTQLAYLNASMAIRAILMLFPWILNSVGLTMLSRYTKIEERDQFRQLLNANLLISFAAVIASVFIVVIFGEKILGLYGSSFSDGLSVLHVLLISLAAEAMALPLYQALSSRGHMWSTFLLALLPRDILLLALSLLWIGAHGALGIAWAQSVAFSYTLLISAALIFFHSRTRNAGPARNVLDT